MALVPLRPPRLCPHAQLSRAYSDVRASSEPMYIAPHTRLAPRRLPSLVPSRTATVSLRQQFRASSPPLANSIALRRRRTGTAPPAPAFASNRNSDSNSNRRRRASVTCCCLAASGAATEGSTKAASSVPAAAAGTPTSSSSSSTSTSGGGGSRSSSSSADNGVRLARKALSELAQVLDKLQNSDDSGGGGRGGGIEAATNPFQTLVDEVWKARAGNIVLYGVGREGLMMRAFAMRLFHLGLNASVVGDMSAPAVGAGDLLLVSAGPGSFSTGNALLGEASSAGARNVVVTAQPGGRACKLADAVVHIPAQTMADDMHGLSTSASKTGSGDLVPDTNGNGHGGGDGDDSVLPMGSVYEGALYIVFEVVVRMLREELGETAESMRYRHTNLE